MSHDLAYEAAPDEVALAGLRLGFGCELEPGEAHVTHAKMALLELVEQEADADLVREMLAFAAGPMVELEIEAKTGAPPKQNASIRRRRERSQLRRRNRVAAGLDTGPHVSEICARRERATDRAAASGHHRWEAVRRERAHIRRAR